MRTSIAPPVKGGEALVGFRLGDAHCAVPIHLVREILKEGTLTDVPAADACIAGVSDVRGEVLLVLDPTKMVGLEVKRSSKGRRKRWLVLRVDGRHVAWVVDGVTDVFTAVRSTANEGTFPVAFSEWLSWVAKRDDELVFVLDVRTLATSIRRVRASLPPGTGA